MGPMSRRGFRRRGRRRGLIVGAAVGAGVAHHNNKRQQQDQDASYDEPAQDEAPTQSSGDDVYVQLEKLGQLKSDGILTDEEFAAKKKQLLGL